MPEWIDISQPLNQSVAVWPGDTPYTYKLNWTKAESGSVNVGQITMSIHTGTHVDAPFHFDSAGKRVLDLDLDVFMGRARVIHLANPRSIGPAELADLNLDGTERLLIRTGAWQDRSLFPTSIPCLSPELPEVLADIGVRLIGVDVPSVDPIDSKVLSAHHLLTKHGIHILEGIVLDDVLEGEYELIALPLPLAEADGSPVRAILRPLPSSRP